MSDPWGDKPKAIFGDKDYLHSIPSGRIYAKDEMDTFLETLKAEWDERNQVLESIVAMVANSAKRTDIENLHGDELINAIDSLFEKAEQLAIEVKERKATMKLEKVRAILSDYGKLPEDIVVEIDDLLEESVERELRAQKRLRSDLETKLEAVKTDILNSRNKLYENLPTGDIDPFALLKVIKTHVAELDEIMGAK